LISNAIKYRTLDRQPVIRVTTSREGDFARINVQDNGLGLDVARFREKLFGLYKRFHTHTEGKGLGLFLVKLQAEALGGRVDVQSELNQGTLFSVWMRANNEPAQPSRELRQ
ncbi:MAG: ATP-binding protein, partial [Cyclobacteriaceae bacterium]